MNGRYSKSGRSVRIEILRGEHHRLVIEERGFAIDDGLTFHCSPGGSASAVMVESEVLRENAERFLEIILRSTQTATLERCVIVAGAATHTFEAEDDEQSWSDSSARAHLALRHRNGLIELDLDETEWPQAATHYDRIIATLSSAANETPIETIALGPFVTAALIPELLRLRVALPFEQRPRGETLDGDGKPIAATPLSAAAAWPNRFRPSYRSVPVRLPHDVAIATASLTESESSVEGIAIIGPIVRLRDLLVFRLLLSNGADVTLELPTGKLQQSVREIGPPLFWMPRMAGVWGQRIVLGR
jgi:hypothetical protein